MSRPELFTIGVYGWTEEAFLKSLREHRIDTLCDLRRRRGVRGGAYPFANATRLQQLLAEDGIRYLHFIDLSPSDEIRKAQYRVDEAAGVGKRARTELSEGFVKGYRRTCLADFESQAFLERLGPDAKRAALFCVEREPAACHRSVLAERVERDLGLRVTHLTP